MKRVFIFILLSCFIFAGCSCYSGADDKKTVAQINKYKMTTDDLKYELTNVPYDNADLLRSEKGGMEYLDRLIEKEILLQEAQRQGLDRKKDFMKSIESYWEQALLKLLLERKSNEISGLIHVYDDEVRKYYKDSGETLPFARVKADIIRDIRQQKEGQAMNAWIEALKKNSRIRVNKDILKQVLSDR
ncbi:MAG: SurA N-terminal domain-containing protein [Candidatus Omnitrophica bacterium]|nr:SurA N-terminal domain-containing protein [Candidatus Omnitrophota bacterium]